ncbi:dienelactone hydrolase family protein [Gilvimarinus sp. F26214L]|uniref:dienelactone hydrolase family protein n=1 Tax=Gilvimarinus sp. DZF01 TaxID=3461371 RepID=UPI004045C39A
MQEQTLEYQDGNEVLEGFLVTHEDGPRPCVLICHAWSGLSDFEREKARSLGALGYNALAVDMYGKGRRGKTVEENRELMAPLMQDRALLRRRVLAAVKAARTLDMVDPERLAAIGFCFGGLCVLDLARSGADVKGVVSLHGLFASLPEDLPSDIIKAKVLALHGYDDPMVPPEQVLALAKELTDGGVDWQLHAYGLTYHAFTNPSANDAAGGKMFNPKANRRAWQAVENFLSEVLDGTRD